MKYEEEIQKLAKQASDTHDSADAIRFSQAAVNLANAAATYHAIKKEYGNDS